MATRARLDPSALPIPEDVVPGPGWCALMREIAGHVGARATLAIVERFGGQNLYVPADAARSPFLPIVGAEKTRALSWAFGRETLAIPTGAYALARARRAGILALVRAGETTVSEAARILGIRRDYASRLITRTDEGKGMEPARTGGRAVDPQQGDFFA